MTFPALRAIPAALLVAVAIWEIGATRCRATGVPGDDEWSRAAQRVRAGYRPGDLIVFAPGWADPIGRLHLGDLIPVEMAGRMDAARYGRIWELSIRDAVAPDVVGLAPVETIDGPVVVRRYERAAPTVLFDLTAAPIAGQRIELAEVGFAPHRCLLVATPPVRPYLARLLEALDGAPATKAIRTFEMMLPELAQARAVPRAERTGKRVTIKQVPLGKQLAFGFGIADVFTRRDERRPIELVVEIPELPRPHPWRAQIDEWETRTLDLGGRQPPVAADITFVLRWEAEPGEATGMKPVCIAMESRS